MCLLFSNGRGRRGESPKALDEGKQGHSGFLASFMNNSRSIVAKQTCLSLKIGPCAHRGMDTRCVKLNKGAQTQAEGQVMEGGPIGLYDYIGLYGLAESQQVTLDRRDVGFNIETQSLLPNRGCCLGRDSNDTCEKVSQLAHVIGIRRHTAGRARAGVASLERLLVPTLAEVIGAGVDDNGALCVLTFGHLAPGN